MWARQGMKLHSGLPSRTCRTGVRPSRQRQVFQCRAAAAGSSAVALVKYEVKSGDTLWDISRSHGVSVSTIRELNALNVKDSTLSCGQTLVIPHTAAPTQANSAPEPHAGAKEAPKSLWSSIASALPFFELPIFQPAARDSAAVPAQKEASPAGTTTQQAATAAKMGQPAHGCSTGTGMSPSQRKTCPDLWTSSTSKVQSMTVDDCEQVLYDNLAGGLDKDLMLVVYAPWCPYCKDIETSVEQLATGLQRDNGVAIAKLRGDSAASRLWLRAQLGVDTFPAIIGFPQDGGGPLRYVGPRDTQSLLEFMNVHCRALTIGAKPLRLESTAGVTAVLPAPISAGSTSTNSGVLACLLLLGILSVVSIAVQVLKRTQRPTVVEKIKKKSEPPAPADDVKELDQSIMQLLAVLGELVSLRIEVILRRLSHTFTRVLRFLTLKPSSPPHTRPADSSPSHPPAAESTSASASTASRSSSSCNGHSYESNSRADGSFSPAGNGAGPSSSGSDSIRTSSSAILQTVQAQISVESNEALREIGVSVSGKDAAEMSALRRQQAASSLSSSFRNETVQRNGVQITTLHSARDHQTGH